MGRTNVINGLANCVGIASLPIDKINLDSQNCNRHVTGAGFAGGNHEVHFQSRHTSASSAAGSGALISAMLAHPLFAQEDKGSADHSAAAAD